MINYLILNVVALNYKNSKCYLTQLSNFQLGMYYTDILNTKETLN